MEIEERYQKRYGESLIQWIWQECAFESDRLRTICGKEIQILEPGILNHGAGPDFLNATLIIGGLKWVGNIEIHNTPGDWFRHGHHIDRAYNNVILHVVYEYRSGKHRVKRSDNTEPYTLELKEYLSRSLNKLLRDKYSDKRIPCSDKPIFVNQNAFEEQIRKVTSEYFEYKVDQLLDLYDSAGEISQSWRKALAIQIFKTLGIPANGDQMKQLACKLIDLNSLDKVSGLSRYVEIVYEKAFNDSDPVQKIDWVKTGMRPASRPQVRVQQAAVLHYLVWSNPFDCFNTHPEKSWKRLCAEIPGEYSPGSERLNLIKYTVYLPGIYLLGQLQQSDSLMNLAFENWFIGTHQIPNEVIKPFLEAGFQIRGDAKSLGLVHQLKRYCAKQHCFKCEVFKNAIRS